jgi:hypothetical protein
MEENAAIVATFSMLGYSVPCPLSVLTAGRGRCDVCVECAHAQRGLGSGRPRTSTKYDRPPPAADALRMPRRGHCEESRRRKWDSGEWQFNAFAQVRRASEGAEIPSEEE